MSLIIPTVLSLPGWNNSEPNHWQSLWQVQLNHHLVQQNDWFWPLQGDWMARLEDVVGQTQGPIVLVAHSLGCHLAANWAQRSQYIPKIKAAFLVAPPDVTQQDLPPQLQTWSRCAYSSLPFASLVVASSNDIYCELPQAMKMAAHWGSEIFCVGPQGHINALSGLGNWLQGQNLLRNFLSSLA